MKVEIVSTQTIRPPAATSSDKCLFTFSIFDQLMPVYYSPMILFYSSGGTASASDILKKSLSETLTHYFPLTGKIRDNICIDEATGGVEYTEARVRGQLRDILSPPNMEALKQLLPTVNPSLCTERLLVVRQSVFECGGMAIGICISHKVVDGTTFYSFLKSWSASARGDIAPAPYLSSAFRFPPSDALAKPPNSPALSELNDQFASKRFVLSGSQVASLKAKSHSRSVAHPTSVEAVTSLIWQCAMRSKSKINPSSRSSWSSNGMQAMNLRNRIDPPLPDSSFGNLIGVYMASSAEEDKKDLASLVSKMRHAKEEYEQVFLKKLNQTRDHRSTAVVIESLKQRRPTTNNVDTYYFTSVCKLDLYGAADFGWGKPIWATFYIDVPYSVILTNTRSDEESGTGIQVWLTLPKHQMAVFEKDPLLLSFATPNPSIVFDQYYETSLPRLFRPATRVSSQCHRSRLFSGPSDLSQFLRPIHHHSPLRPPYIHSRSIPPPRSIRFISSVLHQFHCKLIR